MDWVSKVAPLLGTAIGGPLGGAAAAFIADKLKLSDKTVEAVSEVLNSGKMSADQIASLKLAEIDFQKFLKEQDIKLEEISAGDRDSARKREMTVKDWTPTILGLALTGGFFCILFYMLGGEYRPSDALLVMLGALGQAFGQVISYYFGSSAGSSQKNATLDRLMSK